MRFRVGAQVDSGLTGAGVFAPLYRSDALDVFVPQESCATLLSRLGGRPADVTSYGNELTDSSYRILGSLAEDFNADGYVDLYLVNHDPAQSNTLYVNRGYGSFMRAEKYRGNSPIFRVPGAHNAGAWGAAAGDVDGDGANDILLGGVDGTITLLVNDVLRGRKPGEDPGHHEKELPEAGVVSVHVAGKLGVLGAKVSLCDEKGRVIGLRQIGAEVLTGCRGPDTVNLAVREPGKYLVKVRYSDGLLRQWPVEVWPRRRIVVEARRERQPLSAAESGRP
jgi:hypothetical protein